MIITVKGVQYDLPLNGLDIPLTKTIDSTFDSAYVETIPLAADYVSGLDLSRKLPRLAEVSFLHKGVQYIMMVAEPNVEQVEFDDGLYVHKLNLVSFTKDLTGIPMENITLTQPKGDLGEYTRSSNTLNQSLFVNMGLGGEYTGVRALRQSAITMTLPFLNTVNSNDASLDGLEIIALEEYNLTVDLTILNLNQSFNNSITVKVKYGTSVIDERVVEIGKPTYSGFWATMRPAKALATFNLKIKPSTSNLVSVDVTVNVDAVDGQNIYQDIYYMAGNLNITSYTTFERPLRTYAQIASKMLRKSPYTLSDNARARLNIIAPEGKYEGYTVYDGLSKIGAELGALVTVTKQTTERNVVLSDVTTYNAATEKYDLAIGESIYDKEASDYRIGTVFRQPFNPSVLRWVATGVLTLDEGNATPGTECYTENEISSSAITFGGETYYQELECQVVQLESVSYAYYEVIDTNRPVREIDFLFFDRPNLRQLPNITGYSVLGELEDYVNAVELNTKNVVDRVRHSPLKNGWGLLGSGDINRISTSNIQYETEEAIEVITKVLVKGLASQSANFTWTVDDVTDLTDQVVLDTYYNTLDSDSDYSFTGKQIFKQNNCLYYRKGDRKIYGMSFTGQHAPTLIGQPSVTRALYESILAKRTKEVDELVTRTGTQSNDDPGLAGDIQIQIYVEYQALTETHARVYKDDQTGFERPRIKYLNESSNINKSDSIGDYAQVLVNRLGGTKHTFEGFADSVEDIPEVGDVDAYGRMCTVMNYYLGEKVYYSAVYVQDYNVISSYIGMNSRHRIEEISSSDTTTRVLRYTSKVVFVDSLTTYTTRIKNEKRLFRVLSGELKTPVSYGYMECYHANGNVKKLHLSLDTDSKGKTIEVKFAMKDNYSAGLRRYSKVIGAETVYFNREVAYTDYYGKVDNIVWNGYMGYNAFNSSEREAYPEATATKGNNALFELTDVIDKDAREILAGLVEIPIMSENSKVRVYNGFAKHNTVIDNVANVQLGILKYIPPRNAVKVDLSQIKDQSGVVATYPDGYVLVSVTPTEACKGLVWYDKDTLDLILAYVDDLNTSAQSINLYYEVRDD